MKKMRRLFFLLFAFLACCSLQAGEFDLKINDVSGLDSPWPMVASIPFGKGELKDASAIRIMSGNREVPSQVDVAATWRDGSIRWALAGFTASPQGSYKVEYGTGVKRGSYPEPLKVMRQADGGFTVDTGAAIYRFDPDKLLPEEGWLVSGEEKIQILKGSGAGAYLVDNAGRTARIAGKAAEIENTFIKEGPGRIVLKRSGWYVTDTGEKLAKADVWLYFSAGTPYVRITHSLLFTEDTNKVWFKDYGLEFRTPAGPSDAYFAIGETGSEYQVKKISVNGSEVYMLQGEYPHFAEREYKAFVGKSTGGKDTPFEDIKTAGDWAHGDYGNFGLTLVMPWLAERYPKEISFGARGARAVLWSGRSGKELDFRVKTLIKDYYQTWVEEGLGMLKSGELDAANSNAQGTARTHDIWLLPHIGRYLEDNVKKSAMAASRQVLALSDTERLCETEVMGYPMLHKDTKHFPNEEFMISEYWDRFILPLKVFPMNGYIAWGCYPDRSYSIAKKGVAMSQFHALSTLREYGVRREPWRHYARSGERRYYDYGRRFSRFTGDWYLAHSDASGSPGKQKGGFITSPGGGGRAGLLPLFWGDRTYIWSINAGDIGHWLLEYYLTGDEQSLYLVQMIKESFKKNGWKPGGPPSHFHAKGIRTLLTLFIMDWDEEAGNAAREVVKEMVDLESQNGFRLFTGHYGPMYKDHRTSHNILEYYLETGDELAKEAFLKLVDQRYRFDRRYRPVGYKNYDGFTHAIAYWMTGDERYRAVVEQTVRDSLYYIQTLPLSAELSMKPENLLEWPHLLNVVPNFPGPRRSFFLGHHEYHNPFIGIPTALKLLSEKGWSGKTTPLVVKPIKQPDGKILFLHEGGKDTNLSIYLQTDFNEKPPAPELFSYDRNGKIITPVRKLETAFEERMNDGDYFLKRPDEYPRKKRFYYSRVTVPSEVAGGLYLLSLGSDTTFTLLDSDSPVAALYCPEGFWSISVAEHSGSQYGRPGEGRTAFFRVPEGLEELEILIARPVRVKAPDGSVAVEMLNENMGRVKIPVSGKAGVWSIEYCVSAFRGSSPPSFVKLINVEPVVAFGFPGLLPEIPGIRMSALSLLAAKDEKSLDFLPGLSGKALRTANDSKVIFDRGNSVRQGGHSYFPGNRGTVEFWYKPDVSTYEIPMEMTQTIYKTFLACSHVRLGHLYRVRISETDSESHVRLELLPEKEGQSPAGFQCRHFFKAGEWTHVAFTWEINEETTSVSGGLSIFLNGKKMIFDSTKYGLAPLKGNRIAGLQSSIKDVTIGPFDGNMDNLRISDIVRYTEDFVPASDVPKLDSNTRALFYFDGNLKGISALSKEPVEAK